MFPLNLFSPNFAEQKTMEYLVGVRWRLMIDGRRATGQLVRPLLLWRQPSYEGCSGDLAQDMGELCARVAVSKLAICMNVYSCRLPCWWDNPCCSPQYDCGKPYPRQQYGVYPPQSGGHRRQGRAYTEPGSASSRVRAMTRQIFIHRRPDRFPLAVY